MNLPGSCSALLQFSRFTFIVCIGKISHKGDYDVIMKSCNDISSFVVEEKEYQECNGAYKENIL